MSCRDCKYAFANRQTEFARIQELGLVVIGVDRALERTGIEVDDRLNLSVFVPLPEGKVDSIRSAFVDSWLADQLLLNFGVESTAQQRRFAIRLFEYFTILANS